MHATDQNGSGAGSANWVIDIDQAVPSRKRLVRGVLWAQLFCTLLAAGVAAWGTAQFLSWIWHDLLGKSEAPSTTLFFGFSIMLAALAAAIVTFRYIGKLRTGNLNAARITLLLGILWLVAGLVAGLSSSYAGESRCEFFLFGPFCGVLAGMGAFAYEIGDSVSQAPGVNIYYAIVVAVLLNSSRFGEYMRSHALLKFRVMRWPILFISATFVIGIPVTVIEMLIGEQWSTTQAGVIVSLPILYLAIRAACEVLQPAAASILPPGWEPSLVQNEQRIGERRRVRVVTLLGLSVLCALLWYSLSHLLPRAVNHVFTASTEADMPAGAYNLFNFLALAIPLIFLLLAVELYTRARRNSAISAAALRDRDIRPPLLYLRSFADDNLKVSTHASPRHTWFERFMLRRRERFEVVLIWHLWRFGPVICVGRPRENLPLLGAARDYLSDDEWRDEVESRIREACAVVVVLGHTEGLAWELEATERLQATDKTLLIIPPVPRRALEERWRIFDDIAGKLGWQPVPVASRDRLLAATLQPFGSEAVTENDHQSDDHRSWLLLTGDAKDEWHYEIVLETVFRYLESRDVTGLATLPTVTPVMHSDSSLSAALSRFATRFGRRWTEGPLLFFFVCYIALALCSAETPGRTKKVSDLHPGQCVSEIPITAYESVEGVNRLLFAGRVSLESCHQPHDYEVYKRAKLDFETVPTQLELSSISREICALAFDSYVGHLPNTDSLDFTWFGALREEWILDKRDVVCVVRDKSGPLTSRIGGRRE